MPTPDPYGAGLTIAELTDAPDGAALAHGIADPTVKKLVIPFASSSERAAVVATPDEGMLTYLEDVKEWQGWNGAAWVSLNPDVTIASGGASAASGFTVVAFDAWSWGPVRTFNLGVTRSSGGDIVSDSNGNIGDTPIATVPTNFRPPIMLYGSIGDGFGSGECSIDTNGQVIVRSWNSNGANGTNVGIITGRNMRLTSTFLKP